MKDIRKERQSDYGCFKENFKRASENARTMFGLDLSPANVIEVLIAVKFARERFKHKEDNLVDACEYLRMLKELKVDDVLLPSMENQVEGALTKACLECGNKEGLYSFGESQEFINCKSCGTLSVI